MNMLSWWQQYAPIVWLLLAIAFAVSEGLTVQLVSIWFAVGAGERNLPYQKRPSSRTASFL